MSIQTLITQGLYSGLLAKKPKPIDGRYTDLTDDHFVSLHIYTTEDKNFSYHAINKQLRSASINEQQWQLIEKIHEAINLIKRDVSREFYYRYIWLDPEKVNEVYETGNIAAHNFFTSVSGKNKNFVSEDCNVLIRIHRNKEDKAIPAFIADISHYPDEDEFLYQANSYFEVLQVDQSDDQTFEVYVMELELKKSI